MSTVLDDHNHLKQINTFAKDIFTGAKAKRNPGFKWISIEEAPPPEQKDVVVISKSGIPLLGRNIYGRFSVYDPINERYSSWSEKHPEGFGNIQYWAEVVSPEKSTCALNSRKQINVDGLAVSIQLC